jgi:hypothetical protein
MAEPLDLEGCREIHGQLMGRVSHISGYRVPDERAKSQQTLADWRDRWTAENPTLPEDFHSQRGTLFHAACEHRLLTGEDPKELHPWIAPFYPKARGILAQYGKVYWAERPVCDEIEWPDLSFKTPDGETRHHVWHSLGYCGTPDLVARWRGKVCLADWKTSEKLYVPSKPSFRHAKTPDGVALRKQKINGWYKYVRTVRQLAAYVMAIEERLDRPGWIDVVCINVITENKGVQQLPVYRAELLGEPWETFKANLAQWQAEHKLLEVA